MKASDLNYLERDVLKTLGSDGTRSAVPPQIAERFVSLGIVYRLDGAAVDLTALGERLYEELTAPEDDPFRSGSWTALQR